MADMILRIEIVVAIIVIIKIIYNKISSKYFSKLFDSKEYNRCLKILNNKKIYLAKREKNSFLTTKLMVEYYLGLWDEVLLLIKEIDKLKLPREEKILYTAYKILILFEAGKINDAKEEYNLNQKTINEIPNIKDHNGGLTIVKGIYNYYCDDFEKCKSHLLNVNVDKAIDFGKAHVNYYIGRACLNLGEIEEAKNYLNTAVKYGEKTFIENKAKEILAGI